MMKRVFMGLTYLSQHRPFLLDGTALDDAVVAAEIHACIIISATVVETTLRDGRWLAAYHVVLLTVSYGSSV